IHDFVEHILFDTPYLATADDGLQATLICEAVHHSLSTGRIVQL
ncbi:TPA: gfo/Idh/MocA family oxidoreductase, partial [Citrobacter amalonaticus]|nr:gfo/Idh/MocA family oxidoreductase [Citrobacter amalonaticus]